MLGEMLDTSPEARRFYYDRLAQMTPAERLEIVRARSKMLRAIAAAGVRRQAPNASPEAVRWSVAERAYGSDAMLAILKHKPVDSGG